MRFENGQIKPCPTCLRVRQEAKNAIDRVSGKLTDFKAVTTTKGRFLIRTSTSRVVQVDGVPEEFIDRVVYVSGRIVYDVEAAKPIGQLGNVVSVEKTNKGEL